MKYRNEWKYQVHTSDLKLIKNKIRNVIPLDNHSENGLYVIRSLYFDDYLNSCMFDNDAGLSKRYKWRIRYYNSNTNSMKLEKKEKLNGMCLKRSVPFSLKQFNQVMNNDIHGLFWGSKNDLVKQFCIDILTKKMEPKVIVHYERNAYVEPISNVRITFDKNISASKELDRFIQGDYTLIPIQDTNKHILEIKFDEILPSYIKQTIQIDTLNQVTFSKYYMSRHLLERN